MSYTDVIGVFMCDNDCHDLAQEWLDDLWGKPSHITYTSLLVSK
jgi:hypothetical protein